jgi:hypothetical protein
MSPVNASDDKPASLLEDTFESQPIGDTAKWDSKRSLSEGSSLQVTDDTASPDQGGEKSLRLFRDEKDKGACWITKAFIPKKQGDLLITLDVMADEAAVKSDNYTGIHVMGQPGPGNTSWPQVVGLKIGQGKLSYIESQYVARRIVDIQPNHWYRIQLQFIALNKGLPTAIKIQVSALGYDQDAKQSQAVMQEIPCFIKASQIQAVDRLIVRGGVRGPSQTLYLDNIKVTCSSPDLENSK